jgi:hypothetical protein
MTTPPLHPSLPNTFAGMAHVGGTGPDGAQCGGCVHFDPKRVAIKGTFARAGSGRCAKFTDLMRCKGPAFPAETPACKYFQARSVAPVAQTSAAVTDGWRDWPAATDEAAS